MKKMYLLRGAANKGKTTTLINLAVQLLTKFPEKLIYFEKMGEVDYVAVWRKGDKTLGIYSGGDNKWVVFRNLGILHNWSCNYIVGTVRTYGGSCHTAEAYNHLFNNQDQSKEKEIIWIDKTAANDKDNNQCQKELFKIVKEILQ